MEEQKKSRKPLLVGIIAAVVVLAALLALLLTQCVGSGGPGVTSGTETTAPTTGDTTAPSVQGYDLYWNVDRLKYEVPADQQGENGTTLRKLGDDGYYHVVFAKDGKQVELRVERKVLRIVDAFDFMDLVFDENGIVVDVVRPDDLPIQKLAWQFYIQSFGGNAIKFNSSKSMDGIEEMVTINDNTIIVDVSGWSEFVGAPAKLQKNDRAYVIANEDGEVTHVLLFERDGIERQVVSYCKHCKEEVTWSNWMRSDILPTASGHYFLEGDITSKRQNQIQEDASICLDLNGHTVHGTAGGRLYSTFNAAGKLAVMDNSEKKGGVLKFTGKGLDQGNVLWARYGSIDIYDITVDGSDCTSAPGGTAVCVEKTATFTMHSGKLIGGKTVKVDGKWNNLKGATVFVNQGKFIMNGGTITGGESISGGGNVYISKDGSFTMNGGKITNGRVKGSNGGNIYVATGATFNMNGGTISGGRAYKSEAKQNGAGGNVYVNGLFKMNGGKITDGRAMNFDSTRDDKDVRENMFIVNGELRMYGGTITGGVQITDTSNTDDKTATIYLTGNAKISGAAEGKRNLTIAAGKKISVKIGTLKEKADIRVYATGIFSEKTAESNLQYVHSDVPNLDTIYYQECLGIGRVQCLCGNSAKEGATGHKLGCDGVELLWGPYTSGSITAGGNYFLTSDVKDRKIVLGVYKGTEAMTIRLDLNGYNIIQTKADRATQVFNNVTAYIVNSKDEGGLISSPGNNDTKTPANNHSSAMQTLEATVYILDGVTLKHDVAAKDERGYETVSGGALNVNNKSTVTMYGGTVIGGVVTNTGGAIQVDGTLNLLGNAVVMGGTSKSNAGNIYVGKTGTLVVGDNAKVIDGICNGRGGNIYTSGGKVVINGNATVSGGTKNGDAIDDGDIGIVGATLELQGGHAGNVIVQSSGETTAKLIVSGAAKAEKLKLANTYVSDSFKKKENWESLVAPKAVIEIVGTLDDAAKIHLVNVSGFFSNETVAENADNFTSEDGRTVVFIEETKQLSVGVTGPDIYHCLCGMKHATSLTDTNLTSKGDCFGNCDGTILRWSAWTGTTMPNKAGCWYMLDENTVYTTANVKGDMDIYVDLNGKTIKVKENNRAWRFEGNKSDTPYTNTLIITDGVGGGVLKSKATDNGGNQGILVWGYRPTYNKENDKTTYTAKLIVNLDLYAGHLDASEYIGNRVNTWNAETGKNNADGAYADQGAIFLGVDSTINMFGGKVSGQTAYKGTAKADGTVTYAGQGGAFYLSSGTVMTMSGNAEIVGGKTGSHGGSIYITSGATLVLNDNAKITNGNSAGRGGNVYASGGKVIINDNATISGGTKNGKADNEGDIGVVAGTLELNGGHVGNVVVQGSNNTAAKITVSGAAQVDKLTLNNTYVSDSFKKKENWETLVAPKAVIEIVGTLDDAAKIQLNNVSGIFSNETVAENADNFTSADGRTVVFDEESKKLSVGVVANANLYHCLCGMKHATSLEDNNPTVKGDCFGSCDGKILEWFPWTGTTMPNKAGYWFMVDDALEYSTALVKGDMDIYVDLNGKTIKVKENNRAWRFEGAKDDTGYTNTLVITDSVGGGVVKSVKCDNGSNQGILLWGYRPTYDKDGDGRKESTAKLIVNLDIYAGHLDASEYNGSKVDAWDAEAGKNKGDAYADQGAIFLGAGSTINMYGGKVSGQTANKGKEDKNGNITYTGQGGAFYLSSGTVMTMSGNAEIVGGKSAGHGGNVFIESGAKLIMNAGTKIIGGECIGNGQGGNVYNAGELILNGGEITGGKSKANANTDDIFNVGGKITMNGGKIGKVACATSAPGTVSVSGAAQIAQYSCSAAGNTIKLHGALTEGASIYMNKDAGVLVSVAADGVELTSEQLIAAAKCFTGKNGAVGVAKADGIHLELVVNEEDIVRHCLCGAATAEGQEVDHLRGCDGTVLEWIPYQGETFTTSLAAANYYLVGNLTGSGQLQIAGKSINIDLNGWNITVTGGRVFQLNANGQLGLTNTKLNNNTHNTAADGGVVAGNNSAWATIQLNNAESAVLNVYPNVTIGNNAAASQQNTTIVVKGTANFYGGTVNGVALAANAYSNSAGAITISADSVLNVYGNTVINGAAAVNGGAIHNSGTLNVYGGTINGATVTGNGDAIYNNGTLTVTGGEIKGGNVFNASGKTVNIGGSAKIEQLDSTDPMNIIEPLTEQASIYVNTADAKVAVLAQNVTLTPEQFAIAQARISGRTGSNTVVKENSIWVETPADPSTMKYYCLCGNRVATSLEDTNPTVKGECHHGCDGTILEWVPFPSLDDIKSGDYTLTQSKNYYLDESITITETGKQIFVGANATDDIVVRLNLNGNNITNEHFRVFMVRYDAQLYLTNTSTEGGLIQTTGNTADNGVLQLYKANSACEPKVYMLAGVTLQNSNTETVAKGSGVVGVGGGGIFTMYGGTINGGSSYTGDGGAITNSGTVIIEGGVINGNSVAKNGGAIYNKSGATLTIDGSKVSEQDRPVINGSSVANGGAIYIAGGTVTIKQATVNGGTLVRDTENHKNGRGGAIYIAAGTLTIDNSVINGGSVSAVDNSAEGETYGGTAIYAAGGTITVKNGSQLKGNTETTNVISGGTVLIEGTADFTLDNSTITGSKVELDGAAVKLAGDEAKFTMTGDNAVISAPEAGKVAYGGAVSITAGTFTMNGGTINGTTISSTEFGGGAVAINGEKAVMNITGGKITGGNSTTGLGGGVWVKSGKLALSGAVHIYDNVGGNVYLCEGVTVQVNGAMTGDNAETTDVNEGVGITLQTTTGIFANNYAEKTGFFSDNTQYAVEPFNGNLEIREEGSGNDQTGVFHCLCGAVTSNGQNATHAPGCDFVDDEIYNWIPYEGTLEDGKNYYLTGNVQLTDEVVIDGLKVNLDLNGWNIIAASGKRVFNIKNGAVLNITNTTANAADSHNAATTGDKAVISSTGCAAGGGVILMTAEGENKPVVNILSGIVLASKEVIADGANPITASAGGIVRMEAGELNLYGSTIKDGKTYNCHGGNVYIKNATLRMYAGAKIINGYAYGTGQGGNVNLQPNGVLEINGNGNSEIITEISGGTCGTNNNVVADIFIVKGTVRMNGGRIGYVGSASGTNQGTMNVGGAVQIGQYNCDVTDHTIKIVAPLTDGASIHVNKAAGAKVAVVADGVTLTTEELMKTAYYFTGNAGEGKEVRGVLKSDGVYLAEGVLHCICGASAVEGAAHLNPGCDGELLFWQPYSGDKLVSSLPSGNYYLTQSVTGTADGVSQLGVKGTSADAKNMVNIDLNGYDITVTGTGKRVFQIGIYGQLGLTNTRKNPSAGTSAQSKVSGQHNTWAVIQFNTKVTVNTVVSYYEAELNVYPGVSIENTNTTEQQQNSALGTSSKATVNMYGGSISGSNVNVNWNGGTVNIAASSTFNMYGNAAVTGGTAIHGGAFRVAGTLNIYGGTVTGGTATNGGAIYNVGTVNISGGTVNGTTVTGNGGAIYNSGTLTVTGSTVSGGSIYNAEGKTVNIGGTAEISRLELQGTDTAKVTAALTEGASIVVNKSEGVVAVAGNDAEGNPVVLTEVMGSYFAGTNDTVGVVNGDNIELAVGRYSCLCGNSEDPNATEHKLGCQGAELFWKPYTDGCLATSGNYYLTGDVTLTDEVVIDGTQINLDLNGFNFTAAADKRVFSIMNGATVLFTNTGAVSTETETHGVIRSSGFAGNGGVIQMTGDANNKSTVNILDGVTIQNTATAALTNSGGGVFNVEYGTVTMYGGSVIGGPVTGSGAAFRIKNSGVLNVEGGTITGNTVGSSGGAIYIEGTLNISNNAVINGGRADAGNGGAVAVYGTLQMTGGTISGGYANNGGAVFLAKTSKLIMSGEATITGGKISGSGTGGNLYAQAADTQETAEKATIILSGNASIVGGENKDSTGTVNGGNVYLGGKRYMKLSDTAHITGGVSKGNGGNVNLNGANVLELNGTAYITGGTGGSTNTSHGSADVCTVGGTVIMNGGQIGYLQAAGSNNSTISVGGTVVIGKYSIGGSITDGALRIHSALNANSSILVNKGVGTKVAIAALTDTTADAWLALNTSAQYITGNDNTTGYAKTDGIYLMSGIAYHCLCGNSADPNAEGHKSGCNGNILSWQPCDNLNNLKTAGSYYLTQSFENVSQVSIGDATSIFTVNLDMNGYNITAAAGAAGTGNRAFGVWFGATLTITNTNANPGNNPATDGDRGVISAGGHKDGSGVIHMRCNASTSPNYPTVNIYSGVTLKNTQVLTQGTSALTTNGGVINVPAGCTFNMYGGTVSGGPVNTNGGAVWLGGTMYMSGDATVTKGSIAGDTSKGSAGIFAYGGTLTMEGGYAEAIFAGSGKSSPVYVSGDARIGKYEAGGTAQNWQLRIAGALTENASINVAKGANTVVAVAELSDETANVVEVLNASAQRITGNSGTVGSVDGTSIKLVTAPAAG